MLQLESPILGNAGFAAMRAYMADTAAEIDCTFLVTGGKFALRDALARIRSDCETAVANGIAHLVLTDRRMDADRAAVPMILATAAVHSHLIARSPSNLHQPERAHGRMP